MAPEVLTIPTVPQSRLKALLQANALLYAVLSGFCFMFRKSFAATTAKSELVGCSVGIALAFHAVFLFRIAMRQPVSTRLVAVAALSDFVVAGGVVAIAAVGLLKTSQTAVHFLFALSALQAACGVGLGVLSHLSSHGYTPPEVIAV